MSMRVLFEEQLNEVSPMQGYLGTRSIDQAVMEQMEMSKKIGAEIDIGNARAFVDLKIAEYEAHRGKKMVFAIVEDGEANDDDGSAFVRLMLVKLWEDELDTLHERFRQSPIPSTTKLPRLVRIS